MSLPTKVFCVVSDFTDQLSLEGVEHVHCIFYSRELAEKTAAEFEEGITKEYGRKPDYTVHTVKEMKIS